MQILACKGEAFPLVSDIEVRVIAVVQLPRTLQPCSPSGKDDSQNSEVLRSYLVEIGLKEVLYTDT